MQVVTKEEDVQFRVMVATDYCDNDYADGRNGVCNDGGDDDAYDEV